MASHSVPSLKSANPQTVNIVKTSPTSFVSLSRELRDQIYGYIVVANWGSVVITGCATEYGDGEEIKAIRAILRSSDSCDLTTRFAREAYEVFFSQNIFEVPCDGLSEFLTRKSLYLKNEGVFNIGAWVGGLDVIISERAYFRINRDTEVRDKLGNELRQLLGCPRLHTVSLSLDRFGLKRYDHSKRDEWKWLYDILNAIADVCTQLQGKIGRSFKIEVAGEAISWRQLLSP